MDKLGEDKKDVEKIFASAFKTKSSINEKVVARRKEKARKNANLFTINNFGVLGDLNSNNIKEKLVEVPIVSRSGGGGSKQLRASRVQGGMASKHGC